MCQCFLLAVSFNIYMNLPRHKVVGAIVRLNTNSNKLRHSDKASEQVRISPFSLKKIVAFIDVCCKFFNDAVSLFELSSLQGTIESPKSQFSAKISEIYSGCD